MNNQPGQVFQYGKEEYVIDSVQPVSDELKALIKEMNDNGKEAAFYFASKVLKSSKKSKQGGMFIRHIKSGNFIKV